MNYIKLLFTFLTLSVLACKNEPSGETSADAAAAQAPAETAAPAAAANPAEGKIFSILSGKVILDNQKEIAAPADPAAVTFLFIRHAETLEGRTSLSPVGHARTGALARLLAGTGIAEVYADGNAAVQTGIMSARSNQCELSLFKQEESGEFLQMLLNKFPGRRVLVVGTAETLNGLLGILSGKTDYAFPAGEFDNAFLVFAKSKGSAGGEEGEVLKTGNWGERKQPASPTPVALIAPIAQQPTAIMTCQFFFPFLFLAFLSNACSVKPFVERESTVARFTQEEVVWENGRRRSLPDAKTTFFLVRHAEKEFAAGDPGLSEAGKARAQRLAGILKEAGVTHIFSSSWKRTLATAEPLAGALRIPVEVYNERDLTAAVRFFEKAEGGKALVVGHSNTTPKLANHYAGEEAVPEMTDLEYDFLYVVFLHRSGAATWWKLKF